MSIFIYLKADFEYGFIPIDKKIKRPFAHDKENSLWL